MAIFNFLENLAKRLANIIAQDLDDRMNGHLAEINDRMGEHITEINERMSEHLSEINDRLRRIETKQKETSLQIEEIDNHLQSDGDETVFISALIALSDIIEDFYYFAAEDENSPLFEQAQMMWNAAKNKAETAGLTLIDSADEPFDFNIHSIKGTAYDESLPTGYVIKTLKCGYIFKDELIRHAAVIVNKQEVIYL